MLDFNAFVCMNWDANQYSSLKKIPWTKEPGKELGMTERWARAHTHTHTHTHTVNYTDWFLNDKPTLYSQDKFHFNVLKLKVAQLCLTLCDPMDDTVHGILQARILEPFPSPGDLPNPGIEPGSPTLQVDFLPADLLGKPFGVLLYNFIYIIHSST